GEDVGEDVFLLHPPGEPDADGDGRVHMGPGYGSDRVGHGGDGEAEGEANPDLADRQFTAESARHNGSDTNEDQNEGSKEFGDVFVHGYSPGPADSGHGNHARGRQPKQSPRPFAMLFSAAWPAAP